MRSISTTHAGAQEGLLVACAKEVGYSERKDESTSEKNEVVYNAVDQSSGK